MKKSDGDERMACCLCASSLSEIERIKCGDFCVLCKPSINPINFLEWLKYSILQWKIHKLKKTFRNNGDKWLYIGILSEMGSGRISDFTRSWELKKIYRRMREMKK